MRVLRFVLLAAAIAITRAAPAQPVDLTKIERTIAKEPPYKSKAVKYALLVFGPEAKTRIWLALDGDTLYVDRNGNGDLTDDGEMIAAKKGESRTRTDGEYEFEVTEIRAGELVHRNLQVSVSKVEEGTVRCQVMAQIAMPGWKGSGLDGRVVQACDGSPQLGDKAQDAPIIHFGGSWQIALSLSTPLKVGRTTELYLGVGSPGVGPGTTVWIDYAGVIPRDVYPVAEITFPPAKPGGAPIRERYELKERC